MPHTPGPWKWEPIVEGCEEECLIANDGTVVVCRGRNDDGDDVLEVRECDKPLLVAAPEMYALLKEHQFDGVQANGDDPCYNCCPSCQEMQEDGHAPNCRLDAVLKAVEGET